MSSEIAVLGWGPPTPADARVRALAEYRGATVRFVGLRPAAAGGIDSIRRLLSSGSRVVAHVDTLATLVESVDAGPRALEAVMDVAHEMFVYGFRPTERHNHVVRLLTQDSLRGVEPLDESATRFFVSDEHDHWCGQLSGQSVSATDRGRDSVFAQDARDGRHHVLMRAGNRPFLIHVDRGRSHLFIVACAEVADLDEHVAGEALWPWFGSLAPFMIFLRAALGAAVWHNEHPKACFIIDDPLLKARHGFLEYERLVGLARRQKLSASIAFIPSNYRRTSTAVAALLAANPGAVSLCVHGCDHTAAEFGTAAFDSLGGKASLALDRMRAHRQRCGLPFDDVMVFPQGIFSSQALRALKACGYLAAVNSHLLPSDTPAPLALRDLLEVAITRFADFPLFSRRYPQDPAELAFDLFLGKPALLVEHHGYFRNGYETLEAFLKALNGLERRPEWTSLATICSSACLTKVADGGERHVRFYTDRFSLTNTTAQPRAYVLFRRHTAGETSPPVTIDGRRCAHEHTNGELRIALSLDPGETADVRVLHDRAFRSRFRQRPTVAENARALVRRRLCEFRDNHVDTSPTLSRWASRVRDLRSRTNAARTASDRTQR